MTKILPCPYCGKDVAVVSNACELEECKNFENDCCPNFKWADECNCMCVVCDVAKGGCGACGGYATSEEKAISKWNRRM